jgi:hypothetical protein
MVDGLMALPPIALLPYCLTALLPYCPIALLPYCPTAAWPRGTRVARHYPFYRGESQNFFKAKVNERLITGPSPSPG